MTTLANVGVPMIMLVIPVMVVGLLAIVSIEAIFVQTRLDGSWKRAFGSVTVANVISTIIGIPITWGVLVLLALLFGAGTAPNWVSPSWATYLYAIVGNAAWQMPYEDPEHQWLFGASAAVLQVPFFIASILIEWPVLNRFYRNAETRDVLWACVVGNSCTYALLILFWVRMSVANF